MIKLSKPLFKIKHDGVIYWLPALNWASLGKSYLAGLNLSIPEFSPGPGWEETRFLSDMLGVHD